MLRLPHFQSLLLIASYDVPTQPASRSDSPTQGESNKADRRQHVIDEVVATTAVLQVHIDFREFKEHVGDVVKEQHQGTDLVVPAKQSSGDWRDPLSHTEA